MKKKVSILILILALILSGCTQPAAHDIVATTLPVYHFTDELCCGTGLSVYRLISDNVSCLHDYTLDVEQMRAIEQANAVIISGAGLEDFMEDALDGANMVIDASVNTHLHDGDHVHDHAHNAGHSHETDPHIWLSPEHAKIMATNICNSLILLYPEEEAIFRNNLTVLTDRLDALQEYGQDQLSSLACRKLITFHDGFAYFAESFDLSILEAVEEESGSEASAAELIHLIRLVDSHRLPAVFTEKSGSDAAAGIIAAETGADVFSLDMAMSGNNYFDAMYHNIDTIKEALG